MNVVSFVNHFTKSNLFNFHRIIKSYIENPSPNTPLTILRKLLQSNSEPNDQTFSLLLKAHVSFSLSSASKNPVTAEIESSQIHTFLVRLGFDQFVYLSTAALDLYMRLGCLDHAQKVFDYMPERDVVSWNALICGYSRNGCGSFALEFFARMVRNGVHPIFSTLVSLVPCLGKEELAFQGKLIHGFGIKTGLDMDSQVKNVFISMYASFVDLEAAEVLFGEMVVKTVVSWNTMIGAYGQIGCVNKALAVFKEMMEERVEVNPVTIMNLLSANADPEFVHCYVFKTGHFNTVSVITSLVCAYAKHGNVESAEFLYRLSPAKSLVCLTAIISCYAGEGNVELVMDYFAQMQLLDIKLDSVAMVSILQAIANPIFMSTGLALHGYSLKIGLDRHTLVTNGLITMYSKCSDLEAVFSLFSDMQERTLISWNSAISGCIQAQRFQDAVEIYRQMKMYGHSPDASSIAVLLSGCSQLRHLQLGKRFHAHILRKGLEIEDFVGTALIDMYSNCGNLVQAERVFKSINQPCLATWNAMITGYSWYGFEHIALNCYSEMRQQGLEPDRITFLGILAACTHGGLVQEGKTYFRIMTEDFGLVPSLQHIASMVGLLARAGLFGEALMFIKDSEAEPDSATWGALLNGCCIHQEVQLGEYVAKKMYLLDQNNGGLYVLMSNLYARKERWDDVVRIREMMRDTGGDGCSGVSQIELTSEEDLNTN